MNFPSSPSVGTPYFYGQFLWRYNGVGWRLETSDILRRIVPVYTILSDEVDRHPVNYV